VTECWVSGLYDEHLYAGQTKLEGGLSELGRASGNEWIAKAWPTVEALKPGFWTLIDALEFP
jgi:hypothetical protein